MDWEEGALEVQSRSAPGAVALARHTAEEAPKMQEPVHA